MSAAELQSVREVAVLRAADPITLEDLHTNANAVGALTWEGKRVEPALYHRASVLDPSGELRVPVLDDLGNVSPLTYERVDGFLFAPPLSDIEGFVSFIDWDGDGRLPVSEIAVALAAVLPVDAEGAEHFLRERYDVGHDEGADVSADTLTMDILPSCLMTGRGEAVIIRAAPVKEPPRLWHGADPEAVARWFDHWDAHRTGHLEVDHLRFVVTRALYEGLEGGVREVPADEADEDDEDTVELVDKADGTYVKSASSSAAAAVNTEAVNWELPSEMNVTIVALFLASLGLQERGHRVSKEDFCSLIAPALLANLRPPECEPNLPDVVDSIQNSEDAAVVYAAAVTDSTWIPATPPAAVVTPSFASSVRPARHKEAATNAHLDVRAPPIIDASPYAINAAHQKEPVAQHSVSEVRDSSDVAVVYAAAVSESGWLPVSPQAPVVTPAPLPSASLPPVHEEEPPLVSPKGVPPKSRRSLDASMAWTSFV